MAHRKLSRKERAARAEKRAARKTLVLEKRLMRRGAKKAAEEATEKKAPKRTIASVKRAQKHESGKARH